MAIPNQAVAFDADKERIATKEAKERQLALIEEAKARETAGKINFREMSSGEASCPLFNFSRQPPRK